MQKLPVLQTPTQTPTPTLAPPTPTLTPAVKKADLSLVVLNGSGEPGVGQKMAAFLEKQGYTVKTTGNADNYSYVGITVVTTQAKSSIVLLLEKDLQSYQHTGSIAAKVKDSF